jgi:hypothetical protein
MSKSQSEVEGSSVGAAVVGEVEAEVVGGVNPALVIPVAIPDPTLEIVSENGFVQESPLNRFLLLVWI